MSELTKEEIIALPIARVIFGKLKGQDFYFNQGAWLTGELYRLTDGEYVSKMDNQYLEIQPDIFWELVHGQAKMPTYNNGQDGSACGMDLYSPVDVTIPARGKINLKLGVKCEIPAGHYMKIEARSGTSWKNGIETGAGVIDWGWGQEWGVILYNNLDVEHEIEMGDRVAQTILVEYKRARNVLGSVTGTRSGFGSSGK